MQVVTSLEISGLEVFSKGKVRDVYDLGENLLIVASDRISVFDIVLPSGIPDKGKILTALSSFWFKHLENTSQHHLITDRVEEFPDSVKMYQDVLRHRSMLVKKARRMDFECIVRGYLAGSAWKEYSVSGTVGGCSLPEGIKENSKLEKPLFTPSTKADDGHDRNITIDEMRALAGSKPTEEVMARSLRLFEAASAFAEARGVTLLDTKFEFGYLGDKIILIDEALTPDSSRFLVEGSAGSEPVNLDKQFVRDFAEATGWDKSSQPPVLPGEVVTECRRRYLMLFEKLTGETPPWAR
ncbi:MAG: phosphoribosylaminoimidazolesuccinocarboxamide synthase [Candidatus Eisenbacteria bacterium]